MRRPARCRHGDVASRLTSSADGLDSRRDRLPRRRRARHRPALVGAAATARRGARRGSRPRQVAALSASSRCMDRSRRRSVSSATPHAATRRRASSVVRASDRRRVPPDSESASSSQPSRRVPPARWRLGAAGGRWQRTRSDRGELATPLDRRAQVSARSSSARTPSQGRGRASRARRRHRRLAPGGSRERLGHRDEAAHAAVIDQEEEFAQARRGRLGGPGRGEGRPER